MVETFYTYLHGPRTFWGGSGNRTIINNNFFGTPMMQPFGMSMFGNFGMGGCCNHNRGMNNNMFGLMALSSMFMGGNQQNNNMFGLNNLFNPFGFFNNNTQNTDSSLNAKVKSLEDKLASAKQQIKDLEAEKAKLEKNKAKDITTPKEPTTKNEEKIKTNKTNTPKTPETKNNAPTDLDKKLGSVNGYKDLTPEQQKYVKNKIKNQHTDDKGNTTYDVSATVHSGDTMNSVINRFYKPDEKHDNTNIPEFSYNTQTSGKQIKCPGVGEEVELNGISDFGLEALVKDAKDGITREGETQKTNTEMKNILDKFKTGKQKLSKEYVLQNHMMSETAYNKILKEKY